MQGYKGVKGTKCKGAVSARSVRGARTQGYEDVRSERVQGFTECKGTSVKV